MHKQQGWPQAWEYSQAKLIQTLVRASQEVDWSWSQCIKSHHAQTSSGKGLPSHFWTRHNVRSILPGLWRKEMDCCSVVQSKFCISFGNQGPRVWRKSGEAQNPCCLKSSVKFPQSVMIWAAMSSAGVGPLCFLKSTVNAAIYQDILEHFMLPSADKLHEDADFIFQQDLAPAHTAKGTKSWFNDHGVTVLDWPANSPDLNPIENLWGIVKRKMRDTRPNNADELKPLSKKPGLPYHLSSATNWSPPCHAELRQQLKQKEPLPSIEYIYSKWTYFPEGQQFTKNVFFIGLIKYSNLLR